MYVKRRPKGGWVLQKLIPRRLRQAFGKAHYNAYLKKEVAPTKRDADRLASQWAADCDAEIRLVEALPESERKAFIADGGLKAARARLPKLQESHRFLASMRPETLSQHVIMSPGVPPLSLGVLAIASLKCQDDANNLVAPQIAELQDRLAKVGGTPAPRRLGNTMLDAFELWKRTGKEKAE